MNVRSIAMARLLCVFTMRVRAKRNGRERESSCGETVRLGNGISNESPSREGEGEVIFEREKRKTALRAKKGKTREGERPRKRTA